MLTKTLYNDIILKINCTREKYLIMSYIDIFVIVCTVLGLLFGLLGKASNKIFNFCIVLGCVLIAYFTCDAVMAKAWTSNVTIDSFTGTLGDYVLAKIGEFTSSMNLNPDSLVGLVYGLTKVIVFWGMCIGLWIVVSILGNILFAIIKAIARIGKEKKPKKNTAVRTLGIFGALKGLIVSLVLVFPIAVLSPMVDSLSSFVGEENKDTLTTASANIKKSKVVQWSNQLFAKGNFAVLQYEVNGEKKNLYSDMQSFGSLLKLASAFVGSDNILQSLSDMSDDELKEILTNIGENETVVEMMDSVFEEMNLGISASDIDFAKEAEALVAIKNMVEFDEEGNMTFDVDADNLADALVKSDLAVVMAEQMPGALADIDEDVKQDVMSQIDSAEGLDEETKTKLKGLFQQQESND